MEVIKWVSKSIFELKNYNLNYWFKYWKSVVESGQIIITECA